MYLFSVVFLLVLQWCIGQGFPQLPCGIKATWTDGPNDHTPQANMITPGLDIVNITNNPTVTIQCVQPQINQLKFRIYVKTSDSALSYVDGGKLVMSGAHFVAGRYSCECQQLGQKTRSAELFLAGT